MIGPQGNNPHVSREVGPSEDLFEVYLGNLRYPWILRRSGATWQRIVCERPPSGRRTIPQSHHGLRESTTTEAEEQAVRSRDFRILIG
jgi:hypothetical protein